MSMNIVKNTGTVIGLALLLVFASACGSVGGMIEMVKIPAGTFTMGQTDMGQDGFAAPTHQVTLSAFSISKYLITQEQYAAVMGANPSRFTLAEAPLTTGETSAQKRPVEHITWFDAAAFCNTLSELEGRTPAYTITGITRHEDGSITAATVTMNRKKNGYRLPTEAEWEYACRAGTTEDYSFANPADIDNYAWYFDNSRDDAIRVLFPPFRNSARKTHQVGLKQANPWGLFDMHGNVWEWVWDRWEEYTDTPKTNPEGPAEGAYRVYRGGGWLNEASALRSAIRGANEPLRRDGNIGFRVVRTAP